MFFCRECVVNYEYEKLTIVCTLSRVRTHSLSVVFFVRNETLISSYFKDWVCMEVSLLDLLTFLQCKDVFKCCLWLRSSCWLFTPSEFQCTSTSDVYVHRLMV